MVTPIVACLGIVAFSFRALTTGGAAVYAHREGSSRGFVSRMALGATLYLGVVTCCALLIARADLRDGLWMAICTLLALRVAVARVRFPGEQAD